MPDIDPKNLSAQLAFRATGNPPSTVPLSAIGNCYPGLEFDLRNVWTRLLNGIHLHESRNQVIGFDDGASEEEASLLRASVVSIDGTALDTRVLGRDGNSQGERPIERSNVLAEFAQRGNQVVPVVFRSPDLTVTDTSSLLGGISVEAAADRNLSTPWVSVPANAPSAAHIEVDLGRPRQLLEIQLHPFFPIEQSDGSIVDFAAVFPSDFVLKIGDTPQPTNTVLQVNNHVVVRAEWNRFPISPTTGRFIRIEINPTVELPGRNVFLTAIADLDVRFQVDMTIRQMFETSQGQPTAVLREEFAPPGVLTQSLCSPWQHDYRDCGCFYWAASRPDFVNVDPETGTGNNWMDTTREADYGERNVSYPRIYRDWENRDVLKFQTGGEDEQ